MASLSRSGRSTASTCGVRAARRRRGRSPGRAARAGCSAPAVAAVVALVGAAAAIAATGGSTAASARSSPRPAGSRRRRRRPPASRPSARSGAGADWPPGDDGWTIALASLAADRRPAAAVARARAARARGSYAGRRPRLVALREPASRVLDRLHRRLRVSEAEATSALEAADARSRDGRRDDASSRDRHVVCTGDVRLRLCNTAEKALHSPCEASRFASFSPGTRNSGRDSSRFVGRSRSPASLLYVSILASDLPFDQGSHRPVRVAGTSSSGTGARCSSSASARWRGSPRIPTTSPVLTGPCSPTSGATSRSRRRRRSHGRCTRASEPRRRSSSNRSRPACSTAELHAATRRRARARRASARPLPGRDYCPSHQHLEQAATVAA